MRSTGAVEETTELDTFMISTQFFKSGNKPCADSAAPAGALWDFRLSDCIGIVSRPEK
jgi:hypothetical protein